MKAITPTTRQRLVLIGLIVMTIAAMIGLRTLSSPRQASPPPEVEQPQPEQPAVRPPQSSPDSIETSGEPVEVLSQSSPKAPDVLARTPDSNDDTPAVAVQPTDPVYHDHDDQDPNDPLNPGDNNLPGPLDDNPPPPEIVVIQPEKELKVSDEQHRKGEPHACRATSEPIATTDWVKVANWEWHEPSHNPAIPASTPGYYQPPMVGPDANAKVNWFAPHIEKTGRDGQLDNWRIKEVKAYRITRSPAWENKSEIIIGSDTSIVSSLTGHPNVSVGLIKLPPAHRYNTDGDRIGRRDSKWLYALTDSDRAADAPGYIYTIEASTCIDGPWSQPLKLQWRVPNAPTFRAYLTPYASQGDAHKKKRLPDGRMALNVDIAFERADRYYFDYWLEVVGDDKSWRRIDGNGPWRPSQLFFPADAPGPSARIVLGGSILWTEPEQWQNLVGNENKRIKARVRVLVKDGSTSVYGPWSETITLLPSKWRATND